MEHTDLGRIISFSDGVIAVAITLLVLNIEVPDVSPNDLDEALVDLFPSLIAYLLAFALVGRFWLLHHRLFESLRSYNRWIMTVNLAFLALIVLMPFATDLFDAYTDEPLAVAVFGANLGLAAFCHWAMTRYTLTHDFVHADTREEREALASAAGLGHTALFLLSVPVAFVSPTAATLMWVATILLHFPLGGRLGLRGS